MKTKDLLLKDVENEKFYDIRAVFADPIKATENCMCTIS